MSKKLNIGKLYEVEWIDHFTSEKKIPTIAIHMCPAIIKSYGVYTGENKEYLILTQNLDVDCGENNDNIHILKVGIKKVREIK